MNTRERLLIRILVLVAFIALLIISFRLFFDRMNTQIDRARNLESQRILLESLDSQEESELNADSIDDMRNRIREFQGGFADPDFLPSQEELTRNLQTLAHRAGLAVSTIRPTTGGPAVSASLFGSPVESFEFLQSLEEYVPKLSVISLAIQPRDSDQLSIDIRINYATW